MNTGPRLRLNELGLQSMDEYRHVWGAFALPMTYLTWSTIFLVFTFIIFIWTSGPWDPRKTQDIPLPLWSFILVMTGISHPIFSSFRVMKTFRGLCRLVEDLQLIRRDEG